MLYNFQQSFSDGSKQYKRNTVQINQNHPASLMTIMTPMNHLKKMVSCLSPSLFPHGQGYLTFYHGKVSYCLQTLGSRPNFLLGLREKRKLSNLFMLRLASARLPFLLQGTADCGREVLPSAGNLHAHSGLI